ncbi:MAG: DEAD/DEAH box helicase [Thermodesulfobacteria bacterium]|nr:DEAD/DEAH box helicase [Thermodesulfobacteriota bacterium]
MNTFAPSIPPCIRAFIQTPEGRRGIVENVETDSDGINVLVKMADDGSRAWTTADQLTSALAPGAEVVHRPFSKAHISLGRGVVKRIRTLGGRQQALVEFAETGKICWLPHEALALEPSIKTIFAMKGMNVCADAERFRLRTLAYGLESYHADTGSFARLDIDPLPHQVGLVHKLITSGNLNWLIAEDVGMGKTIEVGMLLSALMARKRLRRVLLVVPAGLLRQWKEELHFRMGLSEFAIYGVDFHINDLRDWKRYDHVIASVDTLKSQRHLDRILAAPDWDLVVFDEAHRLTRQQNGRRFYASDRYKMAAALRARSPAVLLLTATPHQGRQDKFQGLLELLRPELKQQIRRLDENRSILGQMIIRNSKAKAIDQNGRLIFKGKEVRRIEIELSPEEKEFDRALRSYFRDLHHASMSMDGMHARAVGFVMNIYRKLSASSIAAIKSALARRLERLKRRSENINEAESWTLFEEPKDERFAGEGEEEAAAAVTPASQFFAGEVELVTDLLEKAEGLADKDSKLKRLLDHVVPSILYMDKDNRIVIFTEYKSTQRWLAQALTARYGHSSVALINGEMDHKERERQIEKFENEARFLISTEAGGEGINLHRRCHIMINYDLPWNPMRLVQRIGRLYRYGQKKKVMVFNLHVPDTLDGRLLAHLYHRIDQVVQDMSGVDKEFQPGLEDEILGELVHVLDVKEVLEKAVSSGEQATVGDLEDALSMAKQAARKQRDLLKYAASADEWQRGELLRLGTSHLWSFIRGMISFLNIEIIEELDGGRILRIILPKGLAEHLGIKGRQMRITCNRNISGHKTKIIRLDMEHPLVKEMIKAAKAPEFRGRAAAAGAVEGLTGVAAVTLSWQDYKGDRIREEFMLLGIKDTGKADVNPKDLVSALERPLKTGQPTEAEPMVVMSDIEAEFGIVKAAAEEVLSSRVTMDVHPQSMQIIGYCRFF